MSESWRLLTDSLADNICEQLLLQRSIQCIDPATFKAAYNNGSEGASRSWGRVGSCC